MVVRRSVLQSAISIEAFYAIVRFQIKNPALVCTATFTESLSAELSDRTRSASNCYCGEAGLSHGTALFILVRCFYSPSCLRSIRHYLLNISELLICTTGRISHALPADHRHISSFLLRPCHTGIMLCSCCSNKTSRFVTYFRMRVSQLVTWNEMSVCGASFLASSLIVTVWDVRDHKLARVTSLLSESVRLYFSPAASCLLVFLAAFLLAVISPIFLSVLSAFFSSVSISVFYSVVMSFWFRTCCVLLALLLNHSNARLHHFYIVICGALLLLPFTSRPRFLKARIRWLTLLDCIVYHRPSSSTCSALAASHDGISATGVPL